MVVDLRVEDVRVRVLDVLADLTLLTGLMEDVECAELTVGLAVDEGAARDVVDGWVEVSTAEGLFGRATVDEEAAELAESDDEPPGPETLVVISPFSMYTPEKCQSSGAVSLRPVDDGSLRTPRCQSAPLEEALTETGGTISLRSSASVEW